MPQLLVAFGVFAAVLLLMGLLLKFMNVRYPPKWRVQKAAHREALTYLAEVILAQSSTRGAPASVLQQVDRILQILQPPKDVHQWESEIAADIYREDDLTDPWEKAVAELFEFARANLCCEFDKQQNAAAYERVRSCLADLGIEVKGASEMSLGRL